MSWASIFTFMAPDATEEEISAAIKETPAASSRKPLEPCLVVTDIEAYARAAHRARHPADCGQYFPTPVNCRPIEFGADIVVHSTSKLHGRPCRRSGRRGGRQRQFQLE